jgi:hypothetical protein
MVQMAAAQKAHPFGDERTVNQAFPAAIPAEMVHSLLVLIPTLS